MIEKTPRLNELTNHFLVSRAHRNTTMQLGFVSAILPDLSFREVFETAKRIGFDCVDVCFWPTGKA